ncbi:MAG TPA: DNA-formamidopyrimidine glycosylase [Bacilli bacterium]|nr:DNA-formamidopyrimidine glycosylase [Bacilli bacterium]
MPELPEVETVRKLLEPVVKNEEIADIVVYKKRIVQGSPDVFINTLRGHHFTSISRIGKYLIFHLDNNLVLLSHLRMEGKYIEIGPKDQISRFCRVLFVFKSGKRLCYDDSRQFGIMKLTDEKHFLTEKELTNVGPEPFVVDKDYFYQRLHRLKKSTKEAILDQKIMTGLGNIYADEVLFATKIHPETPACTLSKSQTDDIISSSIRILNAAIAAGGSTIRSYHPSKGIDGHFQNTLQAYGREGEKCSRCGHIMKKIRVGGRGTTYCPYCQINPTKPVVVGITGPVASGKSLVTKIFTAAGFVPFDSDMVVRGLYDDAGFKDVVEKILETNITDSEGRIDRRKIGQIIAGDDRKRKAIEHVIHPLVRTKLEEAIANSSAPFLVAEVPLLFESGFEDLMQYVVGVTTETSKQIEFLKNRGSDVDLSLNLNASNKFARYEKKVDYLIINLFSQEELKTTVNKIIFDIKSSRQ